MTIKGTCVNGNLFEWTMRKNNAPTDSLVTFLRTAEHNTVASFRNQPDVTKINRDHVASLDPKLAKVILDLHERAIDYGAHFNVMGWAASFEVVDRDGGLAEMAVLTTDEGEIKFALHFTAMCGVGALRLF